MRRRFSIVLTALIAGTVLASGFGLATQISEEGGEKPISMSWLSDWLYRKEHSITGSTAGEQFNYPIMLNVRFDNGVDFEGTVYLEGKCQTDFGDIRFANLAGDRLDYWIQQKVDSVHALVWVDVGFIPQHPDNATICLYYGNPNASTTSNKDWTFNLCTGFEDGTTQGWGISWSTWVNWDGVTAQSVFQGNYSRGASRKYGSNAAGQGNFYEEFAYLDGVYLPSGSYMLQGAARFVADTVYVVPQGIRLRTDSMLVASINSPHTSWHLLCGNFSLDSARLVSFSVEFHLYVASNAWYVDESYCVDSLIVRKWCDPEPTHGSWGAVEASDDTTPPSVVSVAWTPTSPSPFVPASTPRNGELVSVWTNVTDNDGSGIDVVQLSYRADNSRWCNISMVWNASRGLWEASIPGFPGNCSVEFFVTVRDFAGNLEVGGLHGYFVRSLLVGDVDGDGDVDIFDLVRVAGNYGESW